MKYYFRFKFVNNRGEFYITYLYITLGQTYKLTEL